MTTKRQDLARLIERLEHLADRASTPEIRREIETTIEEIRRESKEPEPKPGQRHYPAYETKAAP